MKTTLLLPVVILFAFSSILTSCDQKDKIKLADAPDSEADSAAWDAIDENKLDPDVLGFDLGIGKGATWRAWKKIHKDCMQSDWLKRPYYMGVTNTIDLASVITSDDRLIRRLEDAFTADEIKSVIQYGSYKNCNFEQTFTTNATALLQGDINIPNSSEDAVSAELTIKIQSSKKTKMNVDKWRLNTVVEGVLTDLLESSDEKKKKFKSDLKASDNRIITKVIEIEGFTMMLEFESEVSPELEAKLKNGVAGDFGGAFKAEITFVNKKTIKMDSKDKVFVFVERRKAL